MKKAFDIIAGGLTDAIPFYLSEEQVTPKTPVPATEGYEGREAAQARRFISD